ncbi:PAAR domain-containing protein [Caballeronia humi]|jgi:uncharacterized Zn-binding protein involved in type VI secretion|uniref:PAAR repeat-containing protein n=1 Tax=Caballeronia humi TaxID=326474 RepID=A0A158GLU4_9BURK|nr:PAAR domain-containing protein [Caballeronia humi]SAL33056.1 hypothetical protein AWB65_02208 [Caballeronia humi]
MTRRYDIAKGDRTTAGGIVTTGDPLDRLGNRERAYEGDEVWCTACHNVGNIVCVGPRLSMTGPDGREAALSGDLCICQCDPRPLLVPSQYDSFVDA